MTRVLLVEDSADVLYLLKMELERLGYEVDAVAHAEAALTCAEQTVPDIVVSDLGLPGMSGLELIGALRTIIHRAVPAIALTGASMARDVKRALAAGFTSHMTKPIETSELVNQIELLTAKRLRRKAG